MRIGWRLPLVWPFYISDTIWQSSRRPRGPVWHGQLRDGWTCPHSHRRQDTAEACAKAELRRRARQS